MSGFIWGRVLGYLVLLLMFTGGMYPAIDMTAGEKERRTLEVFLSSPASRREIVMGKILAVMTATISTALLSMGSLVYSLRYGGMARSKEMKEMLGGASMDAGTFGMVLLTLLPMAVLAASAMIAIAIFARSFKEGQSYLTPLVMLVVFPAAIGGLPGLDLTPALALIPVFNASQLIKQILLGEFSTQLFAITLAANLTYAAIAFFVAVRIFEDESVLFRT
jgi:sodium transport system permease protein